MKKLIVIAFMLCLIVPLFSQETPANTESPAELAARINILLPKIKDNIQEIQELSLNLPYTERNRIFNAKNSEALVPVMVNVFSPLIGIPPNLGIGSFIQKDIAGGLIHLGTGLVGTGLVVGGFVHLFLQPNENGLKTATALFISGGAVSVGSWFFGIIRPITYSSSYNKMLQKALLLDKKITAVPIFSSGTRLGLGLALRY